MECIADALGVSQRTISEDLKTLEVASKVSRTDRLGPSGIKCDVQNSPSIVRDLKGFVHDEQTPQACPTQGPGGALDRRIWASSRAYPWPLVNILEEPASQPILEKDV